MPKLSEFPLCELIHFYLLTYLLGHFYEFTHLTSLMISIWLCVAAEGKMTG